MTEKWGVRISHLLIGLDDGSESLVELPDGDIVLGNTSALQRNRYGFGGRHGEVNGVDGGIRTADDAGQDTASLSVLLSDLSIT